LRPLRRAGLSGNALTTNLDFIHRCQIMPGGGVGHHFHNQCEEMFIVDVEMGARSG
jgi:hypothetical protein